MVKRLISVPVGVRQHVIKIKDKVLLKLKVYQRIGPDEGHQKNHIVIYQQSPQHEQLA